MNEQETGRFFGTYSRNRRNYKCARKLKNCNTSGSNGMASELLKFGELGMVDLMEQLFSVLWQEEMKRGPYC